LCGIVVLRVFGGNVYVLLVVEVKLVLLLVLLWTNVV